MILDRIAGAARRRVEEKKRIKPLDLVMKEALACAESLKGRGCGKGDSNSPGDFEQALSGPGISFICEVKKASPSKGGHCRRIYGSWRRRYFRADRTGIFPGK